MTSAGMTRRRFLRVWAVRAAGVLGALAGSPWRLGSGDAKTERIPIEHIVLILRENHSYDNYFGTYPAGNGTTIGPRCQDKHPDPPHGRKAALGGVTVGKRGECHYREEDIPNYFAYAREFVLCDNYLADIRGPSIPNYFMLMAAQTPTPDNPRGDILGKYDLPTIADRLTEKGISWRNYAGGIPLVTLFMKASASGNVVPVAQFTTDALQGTLPAMSWVVPSLQDSEHPPHSVGRGENWTVAKVNAVMQGPLWPKCAILIVYDEWGGFWDHVEPPVVEKEPGPSNIGLPIRYGYRVPCLIISPYAMRGYISHTLYSHMSVIRTIEKIFDVPPLNERDAQANDLLDCFDFTQKPRPPLILTERST